VVTGESDAQPGHRKNRRGAVGSPEAGGALRKITGTGTIVVERGAFKGRGRAVGGGLCVWGLDRYGGRAVKTPSLVVPWGTRGKKERRPQ